MSGKQGLETKPAGPSLAWDDVEVLIVGAGTMGASLAQAYAQSGFGVGLLDVSDEILDRAKRTIAKELAAARKSGLFSDIQASEIKARIRTTTSYAEACRGRGLKLALESATENIEVKKRIFEQLDEHCQPGTILATNSSSLDIDILAKQTSRPDKVVWMHFFYLPHKNRAGEYAGSESASRESVEAAAKYMKLAGKIATPIRSSRKGGAADVIFVALLLEAVRMASEGLDVPDIEAAGREAFGMPLGFLSLIDATGIPIGYYTMASFSDASNPDDRLYRVYGNFFSPPECYKTLLQKFQDAEDKASVRWVSAEDAKRTAGDGDLVARLRDRFRAVGFMTAVECVESGVIELNDVDRLCRNAFLWREGPFALMNKVGIGDVLRIVGERKELARSQGIDFPLPARLDAQAKTNDPWPLNWSSVAVLPEKEGRIVRIMISNPQTANALDNRVFEDLKSAFRNADRREGPRAVVFDSAPIKTFIAGANVPAFIRNIRQGNFQGIKDDTARWQDVIFHEMTGGGRPRIAIVDGAAFGGGVEVALAFALDPGSIVVITDRTSYAFPETKLGIFPGLRGTLTLPQVIARSTGDPELAVAYSRYLILSGATASPRLIRHLGLADFLVPARKRDDVAEVLARAVIDRGGNPLSPAEIRSLGIEELPGELTPEEKEELRVVKDLFLRKDLVSTLYAYGRGQAEIFFSGDGKILAERTARRVANNSPHAVQVSAELISQGFAGFQKGKSLDELAKRELDYYLVPSFEHPDALEGLSALVERRFPEFNRMLPF